MLPTFPFKVKIADAGSSSNARIATAFVATGEKAPASEVLNFMNSLDFKQALIREVTRTTGVAGGIVPVGGPRPSFKDPKDRTSLVGYERDYKLTASL